MVEREVNEVDLVRERTDRLMAVAATLATCDDLRCRRDMRGHAERLLEIVGFKKVAVSWKDETLRRRLIGNIPWRTRRCVWRPGTAELPRREGVPVDNDRRLAAETLVVDERGWRENIGRARRRFCVAAITATRALIEHD